MINFFKSIFKKKVIERVPPIVSISYNVINRDYILLYIVNSKKEVNYSQKTISPLSTDIMLEIWKHYWDVTK